MLPVLCYLSCCCPQQPPPRRQHPHQQPRCQEPWAQRLGMLGLIVFVQLHNVCGGGVEAGDRRVRRWGAGEQAAGCTLGGRQPSPSTHLRYLRHHPAADAGDAAGEAHQVTHTAGRQRQGQRLEVASGASGRARVSGEGGAAPSRQRSTDAYSLIYAVPKHVGNPKDGPRLARGQHLQCVFSALQPLADSLASVATRVPAAELDPTQGFGAGGSSLSGNYFDSSAA